MSSPSGKKRHKLVVQRDAGVTQSAAGQHVESWEMYATVWGWVHPLKGEELEQAQQVHGDVTHRLTIPWINGLTSDMRLKHKGRYLNIGSIEPVGGRRIEQEVYAKEDADVAASWAAWSDESADLITVDAAGAKLVWS